jgi:threonine dehydrogenase-like Zn-dependent dehydrogenase
LGGSWGEFYVAHKSQLFRVPDALDDRSALLLEPFASVLWPFLSHPPAAGSNLLLVGAGSIGLLAIAALKALVPTVAITVLARHAFQAEEAQRLGADHVIRSRGKDDYFDELARLSNGRLVAPILGKRVQIGGFDDTVVCVGNDSAVDDALRFTRSGGTVHVIGNVSRLRSVDWTPLWMNEITIRGSVCYNARLHEGSGRDAFEVGLDPREVDKASPSVTVHLVAVRDRGALADDEPLG